MEILEIKSTVTDMKLILDGHASRVNTAKERISGLEEKSAEIIKLKHKKEKAKTRHLKAVRQCHGILWNIGQYNMHIIRISETEE